MPFNKDEDKKKEAKKKKSFWAKTINHKKLQKPKMVEVIYLRKNNTAEPIEVETKKGFFEIDGKTYHVDRDCIFSIGKERFPLAIIEEEGLIPVGNSDFYDKIGDIKSLERKCAEYQDLVLNAIRHAELVKIEGSQGPKINPKVAIGLAIAAIIAFAIFRSYSG